MCSLIDEAQEVNEVLIYCDVFFFSWMKKHGTIPDKKSEVFADSQSHYIPCFSYSDYLQMYSQDPDVGCFL